MPQITKPSLQAIFFLDPKLIIKNNGPLVRISPRCQFQVLINTNGTQPIPKTFCQFWTQSWQTPLLFTLLLVRVKKLLEVHLQLMKMKSLMTRLKMRKLLPPSKKMKCRLTTKIKQRVKVKKIQMGYPLVTLLQKKLSKKGRSQKDGSQRGGSQKEKF